MLLLTVALTAILSAIVATHSGQGDDDIAVIVDLEERLAQAWVQADRPFIEALLADDWTVTDPLGRILTRQEVLTETFATSERRIDSMVVDDLNVRIVGSVAIATGRTRASGRYQGQAASVVLRFTDVFLRRDGRWQVITSQATTVAP